MSDVYDSAFRTILNDCSRLILPVINEAFGEHYTAEEIEEFVDVEMIDEILDVFYGLSGYKKKAEKQKAQTGMN